jgi:hypothetical protein
MKALLLPLFTVVVSGSAFAESGAALQDEKSLFEMSAPHMSEFLGEVQEESQTRKIQSALSLLEAERPVKMRYDVINEGGLLKVETSTGAGEKTEL